MNYSYNVEPMGVKDIFSARKLLRACFPKIDEYSIKRALCRDMIHSAVIRINGKLVGFINLRVHDKTTASWLSKGVTWINSVAVCADYRGLGVGRALMQWAKNFSDSQGNSSIELSVLRINQSAVRLYESMGYRLADDGESQRWALAFTEKPEGRTVTGTSRTRMEVKHLIPERLRLLPIHLLYLLLATVQDHLLPHLTGLESPAQHPAR